MGQTRIAINGFGRIGRNAFKIAFERSDIEIVAINDIADIENLVYLLKHDSNYGLYNRDVTFNNDEITIADKHIKVLSERVPSKLPWSQMGIDLVIESTGLFTKKEDAEMHIKAGAKRVVISGPSQSTEVDTIVLGANEDDIDTASDIISNASCTTNSLGALLAILDSEFSVQKSLVTTIHSYTSTQSLIDAPSDELRDGRNAAENIIPSSTGASAAVVKALPQLTGKFDGLSVRVPTSVVSLSDITVLLGRETTVEEINDILTKASEEPYYQGIFGVSNEPLVSRDYIGNSYSGVADLLLTKVVGGNLAKIMVWYDNEWGYSNRLVELVADVGRGLRG